MNTTAPATPATIIRRGTGGRPRRSHAIAADQHGSGDSVCERKTERPADRQLPGRDDPGPEDPPVAAQADAAHGEGGGQRDAAARDHLQVAVLLQPVGRVGEGRAGDHGADGPEPEFAGEQVRAEEGERVGEDEERVVADHRRVRALADQSRRRIPDQGVPEGERVVGRPEAIGVEEVERLVEQGVTAPGRLPGLRQRVADVAWDGRPQMQDQGPGHHDREQAGPDRGEPHLSPGHLWRRHSAGDPRKASAEARLGAQALSGRSGYSSSMVTSGR